MRILFVFINLICILRFMKLVNYVIYILCISCVMNDLEFDEKKIIFLLNIWCIMIN